MPSKQVRTTSNLPARPEHDRDDRKTNMPKNQRGKKTKHVSKAAFTHIAAVTQKHLLHRNPSTHTHTILHRDALTHKPFYTQTLLHTKAFTHRHFYTDALLHTENLLHTDAFTPRGFYTQKIAHTEAFTQKLLHTDTFTHRNIYTHTL